MEVGRDAPFTGGVGKMPHLQEGLGRDAPPTSGGGERETPHPPVRSRVNLEWQIGLQFYPGYGRLTDGETKAQLETR